MKQITKKQYEYDKEGRIVKEVVITMWEETTLEKAAKEKPLNENS